jgi:hypothetical protein
VLRKRLFRQFDHATMRQGFDAYNQHRVRAQPAAEPKP